MKAKLAAAALVILLASLALPIRSSYANDMTTFLSSADDSTATFNGSITLTVNYPSGSPIAQMLSNPYKVSYSFNGTAGQNPDVNSAITAFNRALIVGNSTVHVNAIQVTYDFTMLPVNDHQTILSYTLRTVPEIQKYVISSQGGNFILDLNWREISVVEPIEYNSSDLGKFDLNHPVGILQAKYPDLLKKFQGTSVMDILNLPILQFNTFNHPMDSWHFLFDPSGSLVETSQTFNSNSSSKAVSVYALGESSFREGTFNPEVHDATASIDGGTVTVHSEQPPPSAQIQIAGYSKLSKSGSDDIAIVSTTAPPDAGTATGGFPFQVLLVFGGMMGAIAVFVLIKGRK